MKLKTHEYGSEKVCCDKEELHLTHKAETNLSRKQVHLSTMNLLHIRKATKRHQDLFSKIKGFI